MRSAPWTCRHPGEPGAHHGQVARASVDPQSHFVDRRAQDEPGAEHLDLAGGGCLDVEETGRLVEEGLAVGRGLLDLDQQIAPIDRHGQRDIEQSGDQRERDDREDRPLVVDEDVLVIRQSRNILRFDHQDVGFIAMGLTDHWIHATS
jgi:hypothetical protein